MRSIETSSSASGYRGGQVGRLASARISVEGKPCHTGGAGRAVAPCLYQGHQNVASAVTLLDALPASFTDGAGEVY
jgi:hypothetical protein